MNPALAAALLAISALPLTPALAQQTAQAAESQEAVEYRTLRDEIWQWTLDRSPQLATEIGDRRGDGKLSDMSLAAYDRDIADQRAFLQRLTAIDKESLPRDLQVDYRVIQRSLQDDVAASAYDQTRYTIFTNRGGWFTWFASLPHSSPLFTRADYESYISRLEAYPEVNRQGIARSREAVRRGLTQPCEPMQGLADRIASQIPDDYRTSPFWQPFTERPQTIPEAEWAALIQRGEAALTGAVLPAYREFLDFYRTEYEPACRTGEPGVGATPSGAEYYRHLAASFTTTDMTPDAIHQLGLQEVARIRAEMEQVAATAGFPSREAYIEHLRTDPQYYAKTPEELIEEVSALAKYLDGWMPRLFGTLPRLPYTVLPIPAAQAPGNTTAYYERGSLATGQPGIYRVNTTELDQRPLWELPALGVHEAVPGHHHQIALQQELDVHPLRANGTFFTAFVEGWGLYSERLGIEMGVYDTPAKDMGRLSYEMWRAARLVVDTGLHAKGWSRQQAIDYMLDNTALAPGNIEAEVNRYITWPGQALAYKVGELKIRELRAQAEAELGERFDIRAFHDAVLLNGAIPLDVLEEEVEAWIERTKAA